MLTHQREPHAIVLNDTIIQWNLLITDTLRLCLPVLYMEVSLTGRSKYIVNIMAGTSVGCLLYRGVRYWERSLMEVPLYT